MPRAVVYESPAVQMQYAELARARKVSPSRRARNEKSLVEEAKAKAKTDPQAKGAAKDGGPNDGYLDKIAKYVPAEIITMTTLAVAAIDPSSNEIWLFLAGGALLNVLYLFGTALQASETPLPRWYFYPLTIVAYCLWAIAIIGPVGEKFGVGGDNVDAEKTFVLALAAFLVPLLDLIFSKGPERLKGSRR